MEKMNTNFTHVSPVTLYEEVYGVSRSDFAVHMYEQVDNRPKIIDDVICHYLDGQALKEALFVIDNIREHKMKIKWSAVNVWSVWFKRKHVCDLRLNQDSLHIGPVNDVLGIRITNMSYDHDSLNRLIEALRDSIAGTQEPVLAHQ